MRYRMIFAKTQQMRFTGHLDLFSALERTMRRANLPLKYSEGYNKHPKMTLASALPLGYTSENEILDFWLEEDLKLIDLENKIINALPPGLKLISIKQVELASPKLPTLVESAVFEISIPGSFDLLQGKINELDKHETILFDKIRKGKRKTIDLKELILGIEIKEAQNGQRIILLELTATEGKTGRPDDILEWLGIDPLSTKIHRVLLKLKPI